MKHKILNLSNILAHLGHSNESAKVSLFAYAQKTYTVQSGVNVPDIYENDLQYKALIEKSNPGLNWNKLQIGQKIILPDKPIYPNNNMNYSLRAVLLIKNYEKFSAIAYDDGFGNMTIGYGHKIKPGESFEAISLDTANKILRDDLDIAADFVRRNVSVKLNHNQFDAVVSLVFNAGGQAVYNTELFKALDSGDFQAVRRLFPTTLVGSNQGGVKTRRAAEAKIFAS
jgi:lysozyme